MQMTCNKFKTRRNHGLCWSVLMCDNGSLWLLVYFQSNIKINDNSCGECIKNIQVLFVSLFFVSGETGKTDVMWVIIYEKYKEIPGKSKIQ